MLRLSLLPASTSSRIPSLSPNPIPLPYSLLPPLPLPRPSPLPFPPPPCRSQFKEVTGGGRLMRLDMLLDWKEVKELLEDGVITQKQVRSKQQKTAYIRVLLIFSNLSPLFWEEDISGRFLLLWIYNGCHFSLSASFSCLFLILSHSPPHLSFYPLLSSLSLYLSIYISFSLLPLYRSLRCSMGCPRSPWAFLPPP
jgi:hypothetical protein